MTSTTERVRELNDALRTREYVISALGDFIVTCGVTDHGAEFVTRAVHAVRYYSDFTPENDPHGEHDFGAFEIDGEKLFFKIENDDQDPTCTRRVLTILLAEEY